jgi:hypothetical protein
MPIPRIAPIVRLMPGALDSGAPHVPGAGHSSRTLALRAPHEISNRGSGAPALPSRYGGQVESANRTNVQLFDDRFADSDRIDRMTMSARDCPNRGNARIKTQGSASD